MPEPSLHHVGFVVASIAASMDQWSLSLAASSVSQTFEDPIQGVRIAFLDLPGNGATKFELIEPAGPESPVARFLEKGGGLHHVCFEVDRLEEQIARMKGNRAVLVRRPEPAVAFGGRRIAWMLTREKLLVEYLERSPAV